MKKFLKLASFALILCFAPAIMFGCDLFGGGNKITEEVWQEAFDLNKFSVTQTSSEDPNETIIAYIDLSENKVKIDDTGDINYFSKVDNVCYMYYQDGGEWGKYQSSVPFEQVSFQNMIGDLEFDSFTYNSDKKYFEAENVYFTDYETTIKSVKVYFDDLKLDKIVLSNGTSTINFEFDYSDFSFTLPQVNQGGGNEGVPPAEAGEQVTASQWASAFAQTKYAYTMIENGETEATAKVDGNVSEAVSNGQTMYAEISGNNFYTYFYDADEETWVRVTQDISESEDMKILELYGSMLSYNSATYNNGVYTIDFSGVMECQVTFENGKVSVVQFTDGEDYSRLEFSYSNFTITLPQNYIDAPNGGEGNEGTGNEGIGNEGNEGTGNEGTGSEGGEYNPAIPAGEEVSASQWNNAFTKTTYAYAVMQDGENEANVTVDGNLVCMENIEGTFYFEFNGNEVTMYFYESSSEEWQTGVFDSLTYISILMLNTFSSLFSFDNATYVDGVYYVEENGFTFQLAFEDGELREVEAINGTHHMNYTFIYENVQVTLPQINQGGNEGNEGTEYVPEIQAGQEITSSQFSQALETSKYSYVVKSNGEILNEVYVDGDIIKVVDSSITTYFEFVNGSEVNVYYYDSETEEWWIATQDSAYVTYMFMLNEIANMVEYEDATYVDGVYYGEVDGLGYVYQVAFESNLLREAYVVVDENVMNYIFGYNDFSITLPEINQGSGNEGNEGTGDENNVPSIEAGVQITESQWQTALAQTKYSFRVSEYGVVVASVIVDGNILCSEDDEGTYYFELNGDNATAYFYDESTDEWYAQTFSAENVIYMFALSFIDAVVSFDALTYNDGIYTAEVESAQIQISFNSNGYVKEFQAYEYGYVEKYQFDYADYEINLPEVNQGGNEGDENQGNEGSGSIVAPGEEVTEEEWNNAFTETKYAYVVSMTSNGTTQSVSVQVDGNLIKAQNGSDVRYLQISGEDCYGFVYDEANETWKRMLLNNPEDALAGVLIFDMFAQLPYSVFTFSEGVYSFSQQGISISITFEDAKVKMVTFPMSSDPTIAAVGTYVFDYSDFVITLPTEYVEAEDDGSFGGSVSSEVVSIPTVEAGEEITEEEWNSAIAITKYRLISHERGANGGVEAYIDGNIMYANIESEFAYYEITTEGAYKYVYNNSAEQWERYESDYYIVYTFTILVQLDDMLTYQDLAFKGGIYTFSMMGMDYQLSFENAKLKVFQGVQDNFFVRYDLSYEDFAIALPESFVIMENEEEIGKETIEAPAVEAGEQVTAEQWANAFAIEKYSVTGTAPSGVGMFAQIDGNIARQEANGETIYTEEVDGVFYVYYFNQETQVWVKQIMENEEGISIFPYISEIMSYETAIFENGVYTFSIENIMTAKLTFVDGKVSVFQMEMEDNFIRYELDYSDFEITLPEIADEMSNSVKA